MYSFVFIGLFILQRYPGASNGYFARCYMMLNKESPLRRKSKLLSVYRFGFAICIEMVRLVWLWCHLGHNAGLPSPNLPPNGAVALHWHMPMRMRQCIETGIIPHHSLINFIIFQLKTANAYRTAAPLDQSELRKL